LVLQRNAHGLTGPYSGGSLAAQARKDFDTTQFGRLIAVLSTPAALTLLGAPGARADRTADIAAWVQVLMIDGYAVDYSELPRAASAVRSPWIRLSHLTRVMEPPRLLESDDNLHMVAVSPCRKRTSRRSVTSWATPIYSVRAGFTASSRCPNSTGARQSPCCGASILT